MPNRAFTSLSVVRETCSPKPSCPCIPHPHVYNLPSAVTTAEWKLPQLTDVMWCASSSAPPPLLSSACKNCPPNISSGILLYFVVPLALLGLTPLPWSLPVPVSLSASLSALSALDLCELNSSITGDRRDRVSPSPSCPNSLLPHTYTCPYTSSAKLWWYPQDTSCMYRCSPSTLVGTLT